MRLIDAVRLVNDIIQVRDNDLHLGYPNSFERGVIRKVLRCVEESPTINPEDLRPKGKWEATVIKSSADMFKTGAPHCSICGEKSPYRSRYCPVCGAKMEE